MKRIVALCGSTRKQSVNLYFIDAVKNIAKDQWQIELFDALDQLPHFNPDLDNDTPPESVFVFREKLKAADGILICTPEYAMGVPGTLKNAIDWTVSSMEFSNKPVALITASLSGRKAHAALLETLHVLEAKIRNDTQLVISFAKTKVSAEGRITDTSTAAEVQKLVAVFHTELSAVHSND